MNGDTPTERNTKRRRLLDTKIPLLRSERLAQALRSLSYTERRIFAVLFLILIGSTLVMLYQINQRFIVEIPAEGGSLTEGIIGSPRFINPLLALSDADRDLTALVYSGLLKATVDGILIPDLAESFSISNDGLIYSFILKNNVFFHDGEPVTADDIIFTIERAKDSVLKSSKRANWEGVSVEKINSREIRFILQQPYGPFLENTTLGILPVHVWGNLGPEQFVFSEFNIDPIGSGPYRVSNIKRNSSGIPEFYELKPFSKYTLGKPYIKRITLRFYADEEKLVSAYRKGSIKSMSGISPEKLLSLDENIRIEQTVLPRIFAIFFNQNQATIFANREVRRALDMALDKKRIVRDVLGGYGIDINSPIPPGLLPIKRDIKIEEDDISENKKTARDLLEQNGWVFDDEENLWIKKTKKKEERLIFSLATSNAAELKAVAQIIKEEWEDFGIVVNLKIFEPADLNQNVIRPRKYDALLFGEIIGRELDLFAFWHS